jgi:hypothetical protein
VRLLALLPLLIGCADPCATLTFEEIEAHRRAGGSVGLTPCHWNVIYSPVNCLAGNVAKELSDEEEQ